MKTLAAVLVASALGGAARYGLGGVLARRNPAAFPWETFIVNVTGAFVLGLLFSLLTERIGAPPWLRAALLIGFLGSYTTFSTWTLETVRLAEEGAYAAALTNIGGSVAAGVGATLAGLMLGRAL